MSGELPELRIDGSLATITLRRPAAANRLEAVDLAALLAQFRELDSLPQVRVLILRAQGRYFCSGYNLNQLQSGGGAGAQFEAVANALEDLRPVTIALLQGGVFGGATDLALACDFRLGTPAVEAFVPSTRLGLHFYERGLQRFVSRLGLTGAKRLLLAVERMDADGLQACGFLERVCPDVQALEAAAADLAERLIAMAPLALLGMKYHLNRIARGACDSEALARDVAAASASEDLSEGVAAWAEKRVPVFKGK